MYKKYLVAALVLAMLSTCEAGTKRKSRLHRGLHNPDKSSGTLFPNPSPTPSPDSKSETGNLTPSKKGEDKKPDCTSPPTIKDGTCTAYAIPIRPGARQYTIELDYAADNSELRSGACKVSQARPNDSPALVRSVEYAPQSFGEGVITLAVTRDPTPGDTVRVSMPGAARPAEVTIGFWHDQDHDQAEKLIAEALKFVDKRLADDEKAQNRVHLVFDEKGLPQHRFLVPVDTDDRVIVHLLVDSRQRELYHVSVDKADITTFPIYTTLGLEAIALKDGGPLSAQCKVFRYEMTEYTIGPLNKTTELKIQIPVQTTNDANKWEDRQKTKSYFIPVRRLYNFEAKFGVFGVTGIDRYFASPQSGGLSTVARTRSCGTVDAAVCIIPYVWDWGGRDLVEEPHGKRRFNPLVGVGLDHFGNNLFLGIAYLAGRGIDIAAGLNVRKADVLLRGVGVGSTVTTGSGFTESGHQAEFFFGFTAPADVFSRLIRTVFKK